MSKDTMITLAVVAAVAGVAYLVLRPGAMSSPAMGETGSVATATDNSTGWLREMVARLRGPRGSNASDYSADSLDGYTPPASTNSDLGPNFSGWWG